MLKKNVNKSGKIEKKGENILFFKKIVNKQMILGKIVMTARKTKQSGSR